MTLIIRDDAVWKPDPADSTALLSAGYRDIIPEIERLRAGLHEIAAIGDEDNEWDGCDKFRNARAFAQRVLDGAQPLELERAEIKQLRAALQYVLEDDGGIMPRATSACRAVIRRALEQKP